MLYKYNSVIPVLSAQFITAPTGKPRDILNLAPAEPPRPENHIVNEIKTQPIIVSHKTYKAY